MIYVCPHYADPFSEIKFQTLKDAEDYSRVYEQVTGKKIEIEVREMSYLEFWTNDAIKALQKIEEEIGYPICISSISISGIDDTLTIQTTDEDSCYYYHTKTEKLFKDLQDLIDFLKR